jgi:serine/threonine protein phosphatase PrpC
MAKGDTKQRPGRPSGHVWGLTDKGCRRHHNEDAFWISNDGRVLIVADGMGGHARGEIASTLAVETVAALFTDTQRQAIETGAKPIEPCLTEALETAHRRVLQQAQDQTESQGMGTTLILGYVLGDRLYTCHVGDVRAYVRTARGLEQVTRDHSVVGQLVLAGHLTPEEARTSPAQNEVLQAVGLPPGIFPEFNSRELQAHDLVLLCSDGLWDMVPDRQIDAILRSEEAIAERAKHLVDQANAAGGEDNITVVLYEHL